MEREILRLSSVIVAMKKNLRETDKKNLPPGNFGFSSAEQQKMGGRVRAKWTPDDIVKALCIRNVSLKAYNVVRSILKIPLPALRTLNY